MKSLSRSHFRANESFLTRTLPSLVLCVCSLTSASQTKALQPTPSTVATASAQPCSALTACLKALATLPTNGDAAISEEVQELAVVIRSYEGVAIPELLQMLASSDKVVRSRASYTLREIRGLNESHLPALIDARRKGDEWVPLAIAHVGSKKAIRFLSDELEKENKTHSQITLAFDNLGEAGLPFLLDFFKCGENCDSDFLSVAIFILDQLGSRARTAAPALLSIVRKSTTHTVARQAAVRALAAIGYSSRTLTAELEQLAQKDEQTYGKVVQEYLLAARDPSATRQLLDDLHDAGDTPAIVDIFVQLERLGVNAVSSGPTVQTYLKAADWDLRVAAARTLGFIGYSEASPLLEGALREAIDWRLSHVVAQALAQLGDCAARPLLLSVAEKHWYPPVRQIAGRAAASLCREGSSVDHSARKNHQNSGPERKEKAKQDSARSNGGDSASPIDIPASEPDYVRYEMITESRQPCGESKKTEERHLLEVKDGLLKGIDKGEFSGGLTFFPFEGKPRLLVSDNIHSIFKTSNGILAFANSTRLQVNQGYVLDVGTDPSGNWDARPRLVLPGSIEAVETDSNGELLITTVAGRVRLKASGEPEFMPCP